MLNPAIPSSRLKKLTMMIPAQPGMQRSVRMDSMVEILCRSNATEILPILTAIAQNNFPFIRATSDDLREFLVFIRPMVWELFETHSNEDVRTQADSAIDVIDGMLENLPVEGSSVLPAVLPAPIASGPIAQAFHLLPDDDQALV